MQADGTLKMGRCPDSEVRLIVLYLRFANFGTRKITSNSLIQRSFGSDVRMPNRSRKDADFRVRPYF
jgi:hypothetical protein